jgi:hypothetical protein
MPYYPKSYRDSLNVYFMQQNYSLHAEYPAGADPRAWMAQAQPDPLAAAWAQNQIASRLPPGAAPNPPVSPAPPNWPPTTPPPSK